MLSSAGLLRQIVLFGSVHCHVLALVEQYSLCVLPVPSILFCSVCPQVLALVEHYFLCVLPVPSPARVTAAMSDKEDDAERDDGDEAPPAARAAAPEEGEAAEEPVEGPYTPRER